MKFQSLLIFLAKNRFEISCKLSPKETIYMKFQSLFSGKIKKNISKCRLLKFLPMMFDMKRYFS